MSKLCAGKMRIASSGNRIMTAIAITPELMTATRKAAALTRMPFTYECSLKLIACCVIRLTGPDAEPIVFLVENGVGSLLALWAVRPQASAGLGKYSTSQKLFAVIRAELATHQTSNTTAILVTQGVSTSNDSRMPPRPTTALRSRDSACWRGSDTGDLHTDTSQQDQDGLTSP